MGKKKNNKNFDDFFDATLTIDDVKAKGKKKNKKKKDPVAEDTQADINNNVSDPVVENEASDILTGEVKSTAQEPLKSEEPQEIQEKQLEEEPDKNTQPIKKFQSKSKKMGRSKSGSKGALTIEQIREQALQKEQEVKNKQKQQKEKEQKRLEEIERKRKEQEEEERLEIELEEKRRAEREASHLKMRMFASRTKTVVKKKPAQKTEAENKEIGQSELKGNEVNDSDWKSAICCILGHVDTGKTKILDKLRNTNIQDGEAGGITQQIGATFISHSLIKKRAPRIETALPGILIIDTPGHETFGNLRSRGSSLCNIAVLVVDILHGLEQQTLESIELLRKRKTYFVVALNKIDRITGWVSNPNMYFRDTLEKQKESVKREYNNLVKEIKLRFAENGLNVAVYDENPDPKRYLNMVPTSAITGEGLSDLLTCIMNSSETFLKKHLKYQSKIECTMLECNTLEGYGMTIDAILSNGTLKKGDKIAICTTDGPIVTVIKHLLIPETQNMNEIGDGHAGRIGYKRNDIIKASAGLKIAAHNLDKAVSGTKILHVANNISSEEIEAIKSEVQSEYKAFIENIMSCHSSYSFILMMDMNCNRYSLNHPFSPLVNSMMNDYGLVSGFDLKTDFDPTKEYTRFDIKRGSYTLIDGILLSHSLTPFVRSCSILDLPLNTSDHLPVELVIELNIQDLCYPRSKVTNYIPWATLSKTETDQFESVMLSELQKIQIPCGALNHSSHICDNQECIFALEKYYCDIVNAVEVADSCLPRLKHGLSKPFWSPQLDAAKKKSVDAHHMWCTNGSPRSGPLFHEKNSAKCQYKRLLRNSKKTVSSSITSSLTSDLLTRDTNSFWKKWKSLKGPNAPNCSMIGGSIGDKDIANCFASTYKSFYSESPANSALRSRFHTEYETYKNLHINDSVVPFLLSWADMKSCVQNLKLGKASSTFMKAEHIYNGCPELLKYLHLLFNGLISHGYLPHEFLFGTISPVLKDSNGDVSDPGNYRPITLSPCLAQFFEYCLLHKFEEYLTSDDLQFGFKRKHSTSHAIYALKTCVDYFTEHGSNVFVTFLDCSKAFDKVSHYGILLKLIVRGVPLCFLNLIMYWYLNMFSCCQWNSIKSEYFQLITGTKQGGVLSPRLFALYMDDLIIKLRASGLGCHIISLFLACILYADDLCLITPSRSAMQQLLDICQTYCSEYCLNFNSKKSKTLLFGPSLKTSVQPLTLNCATIDFVDNWKYLGTTVVAGKNLSFTSHDDLHSFYRSTNSILPFLKSPNELVLMQLLYSVCVPTLTYAADVKVLSASEMNSCNVALNNAIRRIFSYQRWESTRSLRQQLNYPNIYEIFESRRIRFASARQRSSNQFGCVVFACRFESATVILHDEYNTFHKALISKNSDRGVHIQSSTLGSLEALITFCESKNIPIASAGIGQLSRTSILKQALIKEKGYPYTSMLCFNIKVDATLEEIAKQKGIKIFKSEIVYNLVDMYQAFVKEEKKVKMNGIVFPFQLKIIPNFIFTKRSPLILGVEVMKGKMHLNSPVYTIFKKEISRLGNVTSIEKDKVSVQVAGEGDKVAIKIESETPKVLGKSFSEKSVLESYLDRSGLKYLRSVFEDELSEGNLKDLVDEIEIRLGVM